LVCNFCRKELARNARQASTAAFIGPEKLIPINDFLDSLSLAGLLRLTFHAIERAFSIYLQRLERNAQNIGKVARPSWT